MNLTERLAALANRWRKEGSSPTQWVLSYRTACEHHADALDALAAESSLPTQAEGMPTEVGDKFVIANGEMRFLAQALSRLDDVANPAQASREGGTVAQASPTLTFGCGDYSCALCGFGMTEPCEHWKHFLATAPAEPLTQRVEQPQHDLNKCLRELAEVWKRITGDAPAEKCMRSCGTTLEDVLDTHAPVHANEGEKTLLSTSDIQVLVGLAKWCKTAADGRCCKSCDESWLDRAALLEHIAARAGSGIARAEADETNFHQNGMDWPMRDPDCRFGKFGAALASTPPATKETK
jgi:hypothetical protein